MDIERKNKSQLKDVFVICSVCGKKYKTLIGNICGSCKSKQLHEKDQLSTNTNSEFGQKIIDLRKQGLSYTKIAEKLSCSKSTVSYHCRQSSRDKTKERGIKNKALCS